MINFLKTKFPQLNLYREKKIKKIKKLLKKGNLVPEFTHDNPTNNDNFENSNPVIKDTNNEKVLGSSKSIKNEENNEVSKDSNNEKVLGKRKLKKPKIKRKKLKPLVD